MMDFKLEIWAILLGFKPLCLDLGHLAYIWTILLGFGLFGRIWVSIGPKGDKALRMGRKGGHTCKNIQKDRFSLCSTGLRALWCRCPKRKITSFSSTVVLWFLFLIYSQWKYINKVCKWISFKLNLTKDRMHRQLTDKRQTVKMDYVSVCLGWDKCCARWFDDLSLTIFGRDINFICDVLSHVFR